MGKVAYEEVKKYFGEVWQNSAEYLFHQIAWDCMDQAGMTTYDNEKDHALIHIYAYVIQMLVDEFSYMAFDEYCSYEYETLDQEPLTEAAIGWFYRDMHAKEPYEDIDSNFLSDPAQMLRKLIFEYRYQVADAIFNRYGEFKVGDILFFSIRGEKLCEDTEETGEKGPTRFSSKEDLLRYIDKMDFDYENGFYTNNGMKVAHWLACHSCTLDD